MVVRQRTNSPVETTGNQINSETNSIKSSDLSLEGVSTTNSRLRGRSRDEIIRTLQKANKIQYKLDYPTDPNYRYRWVSSANPHRIQDLEENKFYEKVVNERGEEVKIHGGVTTRGKEYDMYLMRVPNEIFQISQDLKNKRINQEEQDIINRDNLEDGLDKRETYIKEGLETLL